MPKTSELRQAYLDLLETHFGQPAHDPQTNAVKLLAYDISGDLEAGKMSVADLEALAKGLSDDALVARAKRLSAYMETASSAEAIGRFEEMARAGSVAKDGTPIPFEVFCERWQRPAYGFVLTAHPTFSLSNGLRSVVAALATDPADDREHEQARDALKSLAHEPEAGLTLDFEHAAATTTVKRICAAVDTLHGELVSLARELYPLQWAAFRPCIATVATWVGYDLDGRADIGWSDSIGFRLAEKADQLTHLAERVSGIAKSAGSADRLDALAKQLVHASESAREEADAFAADMSDEASFVEAANRLTREDSARIIDPDVIRAAIDEAIIGEADSDVRSELIVLAAAVASRGLGMAHVHVRINAVQVHNALRAHFGWTDTTALDGRLALSNLTDEIARVTPATINFGSVHSEQTTAVRQWMLLARFLTLIDCRTPIRYLIAECEQPLTPLAALYFAKQFGIHDRVDISPLFETPTALERGNRLVEQMLANPAFRAYVEQRGRLAIQTGFSDAGRFIGQVTASLAIERLQVQVAKLMDAAGLSSVEALVFNTHGESLGRGSHPASLTQRQLHIMPPNARNWFRKLGIPLKHESSFQGSDGYMLFETPDLALRTVCGVMHAENSWQASEDDPFYTDIAFTWDIYRALRSYQSELYSDPDYGDVVMAFAGNFLFPTGSRKSKRGSESGAGRSDLSLLRAIPHNAALQQIGQIPHVSSGIGTVAANEFDRFVELCRNSPRAAALIELVAFARRQSSMTAFAAHASVLDAGFWVARADASGPGKARNACIALAARLRGNGIAPAFHRFHTRLRTDLLQLEAVLSSLEAGIDPLADSSRRSLYLLHAIRIALMMHVVMKAAELPPFAPRNDFSREQVLELLLQMRIPDALDLIRETFPRKAPSQAPQGLIEQANYGNVVSSGYPHIHDGIVEPIARAYTVMRRVGIGLSHRFGAYG